MKTTYITLLASQVEITGLAVHKGNAGPVLVEVANVGEDAGIGNGVVGAWAGMGKVAGFEEGELLLAVVRPDAGVEVGLQLQADR